MSRFSPASPELLARRLAELCGERHPGEHPLRVALDAPSCADLSRPARLLTAELRAAGRPVALVEASSFYRDASLRLEYGRADVESFYRGWLDTAALQREVLDPLVANSTYLPSLRDPVTNRSTRARPEVLPSAGVLLLRGELLLGAGLHLDLTVHAAVSRQARRRLMPPEWQWTLPAFDRYDLEVDPTGTADVVIRYDDALHPALLIRGHH
ncbi:MAG: uridine kinase [Jatrophihabitantaceae bacterium]